jgi:uncharacterized coiled-coil protein SlyX
MLREWIAGLEAQLAQKNAEIERLRAEINRLTVALRATCKPPQ